MGQLTHLVDDLMEVSRITTGRIQLRREQIAVSGIVERAVETVRPLIDQRKHELTVSLPPDPIWLYADAARLEQVVVNLLTNAAKYTDEGGHIWLSVQQEGDEAVLRVRDTGVGIAPDFLAPHLRPVHAGGAVIWTVRKAGWASDWPWCNDWWKCTGEQSGFQHFGARQRVRRASSCGSADAAAQSRHRPPPK